jgi:DNA polymerase elongation subunit (family B)
MSNADSIQDIKQNKLSLITKKIDVFLSLLKEHKVLHEDLVFTKILSKDYNQYNDRNTLENSVLKQLELNGEYLKAGQILQYIITDYDGSLLKRAVPIQLVDYRTNYDIKRYSKLLIDTCNTVLKPFGFLLDQNPIMIQRRNYC